MTEAVIVGAVRTPMGRHQGALKDVRPDDLGALVVGEVVRRAGVDPALVDEVYLGCANQAGEDNRNVARMAALLAGFPVSVAGLTFNRLCSSGLAAINAAARAVKTGEGEVFVAGGVESMTRAPYAVPKNLDGGMGNLTAWDTTLGWRFPNPRLKAQYGNDSMGETAENLRDLDPTISREDQDRFALESHRRAIAAMESGRFAEEIVPVPIPQKGGGSLLVSRDEPPRPDTSLEALSKLRPVFREGGTVTAGNSSGISDGAAVVLLTSDRKADELGLTPLVRVLRGRGRGATDDGPRSHPGHSKGAVARRPHRAGSRPDRTERGLRHPGPHGHAGARLPPCDHERERRGDRARPSARMLGSPDRVHVGP